jgi:hypothetical protein
MSAATGTLVLPFRLRTTVGGPGGGPALATAGCGGTANVIFDLFDNGQPLGSISIPFHSGRLDQPMTQDFEQVTVPLLPQGWITRPVAGPPWITSSNAPPNALASGDPDEPSDESGGTTGPVSVSAFIADPPSLSDSSLHSPFFAIASSQAQLRFRHSFDTEPGFDGGVLEIAIGTQPFTDILAAGGTFTANGYNMTMLATGGVLGGRRAWSGDSGGWLITEVNLPPSAAQQNIQLRWHFASDTSVGRDGWFIDDIAINEYQCVAPVTNPIIVRPGRFEGRFGFYIDTVFNRNYFVEYKDLLTDPVWQPLTTLHGDGTTQFIIDPTRGPAQRFYQFRVE